jgi:hypothetical protein
VVDAARAIKFLTFGSGGPVSPCRLQKVGTLPRPLASVLPKPCRHAASVLLLVASAAAQSWWCGANLELVWPSVTIARVCEREAAFLSLEGLWCAITSFSPTTAYDFEPATSLHPPARLFESGTPVHDRSCFVPIWRLPACNASTAKSRIRTL